MEEIYEKEALWSCWRYCRSSTSSISDGGSNRYRCKQDNRDLG
jgi:hypothetical protein